MQQNTSEDSQIAILGAGALGAMYGNIMTENLGRERVYFLADEDRTNRYREQGIYCNGNRGDFRYHSPGELEKAPDLILIAVKFTQLEEALVTARQAAGRDTIFLSVLNGISSEEILIQEFGKENVLYGCMQGTDAVREENRIFYTSVGTISLGNKDGNRDAKLDFVTGLLEEAGLAYEVPEDIVHKLWSKLMFNIGVNQVSTVFDIPYGGLQKEGMARTMMREAMREAKRIAQYEDVFLTEEEIDGWFELLDGLRPDRMPSMRQDMLAKRMTELELFAGTIKKKGLEYGVQTPVNDYLYDGIILMEQNRGIVRE